MPGYQNDPGTVQQEAGFGFYQRFWTESYQDNFTALNGGNQNNSPVMNSMFNRVATVGAIGAGIVLPPSFPGLTVCVINAGANSLQCFAQGSDTINGIAGATGVPQMNSSVAYYSCITAGTWIAQGLGSGYAGSQPTFSYQAGLTAHAGGGQGSAVPITANTAFFSTVGTAGDSAVLPSAQPGMEITVINQSATNAMNVFPTSGQQINGTAANTAFSVAAATVTLFYCGVAGQWWTK